jgi:hypothetical protein
MGKFVFQDWKCSRRCVSGVLVLQVVLSLKSIDFCERERDADVCVVVGLSH